jgi:hypothetical protein
MMDAISIQDMARVVDYLDKINDPRGTAYGNIRHKLIDIIVIAFTAVLCGYEEYEEMEEFGRLKLGVCGALPKNCINLQTPKGAPLIGFFAYSCKNSPKSHRLLDFFTDFLELPHGIPDESAFRRVLQCLDPRQLQ